MPSPDVPTTLTSDLRRLGLPRTAEDLNDILARATRHRWSPTVLLEHLVSAELEERQRRSIERRLTARPPRSLQTDRRLGLGLADRARPPRA